jgi:hypothetical protein
MTGRQAKNKKKGGPAKKAGPPFFALGDERRGIA